MTSLVASVVRRVSLAAFAAGLLLAAPQVLRAQAATGTITGRVLNEATGQYLRNATVSVIGTNISAVAESGGAYILIGVPAGEARVAVSYVGLDPAEITVKVGAGETVRQDITMSNKSEGIVKLDAFRVGTEREGNFQAIQEQKSALEIKQVVASDAFGDVSEGNIGEFMKLMPGVMLDYVDADVRTVSIGGMDPKYSMILMDGAPVASAGSSSIATGRAFEFEQLSISSIETVELSKTPTPDIAGSALSGVINLRSRGAFDRKGRLIRWSASTQINSHQATLQRTPGPSDRKILKLQPNGSFEYSDVFRDRLGVIAGVNFSRTMVEQNSMNYTYTAVNNLPGDNATEVPRLNTIHLIDAPKMTNRGNYNLRLDYKLSPEATVWARIDYNAYSARNYQRNARFVLNNAVNGPAAADPRQAGVEYSLTSQTSTNASAELHNGNGFNKHGATATPAVGATYRKGAFRADVQGQMSRSTNFYHDVPMGYFNTASTGLLPGLTLRWDRATPGDPAVNLTQLAGPDWRRLENYPAAGTMGFRYLTGKDQKWTGKADLRYGWQSWKIPTVVKWGGDISQQIRNVDRYESGATAITYLGPDRLPNTGDEKWTAEPHYTAHNIAGGNLQNIPGLDRFTRAREFGTNPERFSGVSPETELMLRLRNHWDVKEQVDSLYSQVIFKVSPKFDLAPGVRVEKTRGFGRGPTDLGDDHAKLVLTGNPLANIPTNTAQYYLARFGTDAINSTDYHTWLRYLHATYRVTNDLILRASFNDSITRPNLDNLAGGVTINEDVTPHTATIPNPNLEPEAGRNLFFAAEYYFPKRAGFFTVTATRRDINNLIRSTVTQLDPGEDFPNQDGLDLRGFRVTTSDNIGKAHVTSLEFSYRQNMVFLPGIWKRLSIFANYTKLHYDDYENFRRPTNLTNGGLSFDHRNLSFRWNFLWVPIHRRGAIPANGWVTMTGERLTHDMQAGYRFSSRVSLFLNARNIFNQPQSNYWGPTRSDLMINRSDYGAIWTVGMRGQF
ncbi:MAG TPA: TonB-dependent receptor [Opitutaceae bacterium]|nr:TonB-dependent receptor [Opitutaceae bacterium]